MHTARHQIVTGTLGGGLGQNRSLDFDEPQLVQVISAGENEPVPELEVLLELGATEIQHTMLQPEFLRRQFVFGSTVNRDGRGVGIGQATQNRRADLDFARRDVRVLVLAGPNHDGSNHGHDILSPQLMGESQRCRIRPIGAKRNLDQPASVAKIEEDQPTQISSAVDPASQLYLGPLVSGAYAPQHSRAKCGPFDIDLVH
jgi:hypothetical protein